jgi:hypothetical protein
VDRPFTIECQRPAVATEHVLLAMLDVPAYRELLAACGRADPALRPGAGDGVRDLHAAHDRLIAETIERLRHGGDEAAVAEGYFRALAAPVATAARALVRAGLIPR